MRRTAGTFGEYRQGKCQCGGTREGEYRGSILNHEKERERDNLLSFEIEFSPSERASERERERARERERERERERVSNLVVHHPGNGFLEAGDPRRDIRIPNAKTEAALHSVAK